MSSFTWEVFGVYGSERKSYKSVREQYVICPKCGELVKIYGSISGQYQDELARFQCPYCDYIEDLE